MTYLPRNNNGTVSSDDCASLENVDRRLVFATRVQSWLLAGSVSKSRAPPTGGPATSEGDKRGGGGKHAVGFPNDPPARRIVRARTVGSIC